MIRHFRPHYNFHFCEPCDIIHMKGKWNEMTGQMESVETRQAIIDYIDSQMPRFRSTYYVRKMALIGSFARDEQTSGSDIDLLIDLEPGAPDIHQIKHILKAELEQHFGRRVEIASEPYLKPYYRKQILQEAIYVQQG